MHLAFRPALFAPYSDAKPWQPSSSTEVSDCPQTNTLLISFGSKRQEPRCYCLSNSPVNEPPSRFPNGATIDRGAVYRAFFYMSLGFHNKQGLLIKQNHIFISQARKAASPPCSSQGAPMETAAPFPQAIYYSFIYNR